MPWMLEGNPLAQVHSFGRVSKDALGRLALGTCALQPSKSEKREDLNTSIQEEHPRVEQELSSFGLAAPTSREMGRNYFRALKTMARTETFAWRSFSLAISVPEPEPEVQVSVPAVSSVYRPLTTPRSNPTR